MEADRFEIKFRIADAFQLYELEDEGAWRDLVVPWVSHRESESFCEAPGARSLPPACDLCNRLAKGPAMAPSEVAGILRQFGLQMHRQADPYRQRRVLETLSSEVGRLRARLEAIACVSPTLRRPVKDAVAAVDRLDFLAVVASFDSAATADQQSGAVISLICGQALLLSGRVDDAAQRFGSAVEALAQSDAIEAARIALSSARMISEHALRLQQPGLQAAATILRQGLALLPHSEQDALRADLDNALAVILCRVGTRRQGEGKASLAARFFSEAEMLIDDALAAQSGQIDAMNRAALLQNKALILQIRLRDGDEANFAGLWRRVKDCLGEALAILDADADDGPSKKAVRAAIFGNLAVLELTAFRHAQNGDRKCALKRASDAASKGLDLVMHLGFAEATERLQKVIQLCSILRKAEA